MRFCLLIIFFLLVLPAFNQSTEQDTVIHLSQVQIDATRLSSFAAGLKVITFDSMALASQRFNNLDEVISRSTPVYIKSYGQGGLATIAFRGTASAHTGVYWNGIQINPPNVRLFDLSLAPVAWFNSIQVLSGGAASTFASGNIGGSIFLNNEPVFARGFSFSTGVSAGSFSNYGGYANAVASGKKFYSSTGFLYKASENDFPYFDLADEKKYQKNAAYKHYGLMQDLYRKLNDKWIIGAAVWLQSNIREIPGTLVSSESKASQVDQSFRTVISVRNHYTKGYSSIKLAYFDDQLHYMDPESLLDTDKDSRVTTDKFTAEVLDNRQLLKNTFLNTGIYFSYESGRSNNYSEDVRQNRLGLFASAIQYIASVNWQATLILRQDFIEGSSAPFTPALHLDGKIWKFLSGKASLSRNYRLPSFNEISWYPYGNPDLKSERSWNEEASLVAAIGKKSSIHWSEFTITGYNSNIDNWIIWVPSDNLWQPENISKVWSRGWEFSGYSNIKMKGFGFQITEGYTFARSTSEKKLFANDNSYQKQLIYVPVHRFFLDLIISWKGFSLNYNLNLTSQRYTSSDNKQSLPAYLLQTITAGKNFRINKNMIYLQFDINNLTNESYQAVRYYPMPGRFYKATVNFKFN